MDNQTTIAILESKIDHLETELANLDAKLMEAGFPEGIATLKGALNEIHEENKTAQ